jgi:hypothetical protein
MMPGWWVIVAAVLALLLGLVLIVSGRGMRQSHPEGNA